MLPKNFSPCASGAGIIPHVCGHDRKIIVVGAGVIGCSIAWELSRNGFCVEIFDERSGALQGISSAGFGSLTPFSDPFYRGEARDFAAKSVDIYRNGWIHDLVIASGAAIDFCDEGLLQLCTTQLDVEKALRIQSELQQSGYRARLLSVEETRSLEPALSDNFLASLWMDEPWIDRKQYFESLNEALKRISKVRFRFDTKIVGVAENASGVTVRIADGETYSANGVVICNGLSVDFIEGIPRFPMRWVRGDAVCLHTADDRPLIKRHIYCHEAFITPRKSSELLLGTTYEPEERPSENSLRNRSRIRVHDMLRIIEANRVILPQIDGLEVSHVYRNWRPTPPDSVPIFGPVEGCRSVIVANGFIGLGVTLSPAVAKSIFKYFAEQDPSFPSSFSPGRDGLKGE